MEWHKEPQSHRASQTYPMVSEAAAVHPDQVKGFTEFFQKDGCPTEFKPTGEVVFRSADHRRQHLKRRGLVDRNSYY
jgi:hypothetical protein